MKHNKVINSAGPSVTDAEIDLVSEAIREGWGSKMNFYIDQFTKEFSEYIGIQHCITTAHCTDAIHLAMLALGIGPGDEVIVPDLTWVASASPITYVGATPVFADVDPVSWCLSPESLEKNITAKTKAVVVVDLLGNMPDWDRILEITKKHNLLVIEDAAEGIGATYNGKKAGLFGDISLFSFNATKMIMSGQGGALCTNNEELFASAKLFSHHGIDKNLTGKYYWSNVVGYNYNWTNIQAALALAQLRRIDELIDYKKWLFSEYQRHLGNIDGIQLNSGYLEVDQTYWISVAVIDPKFGLNKEELEVKFRDYKIDMRPLFYPISSMPPFQKYLAGKEMEQENPVTYHKSSYGVCLPNGNNLTKDDIEFVCHSFHEILCD
jgi:perosamine synthetase